MNTQSPTIPSPLSEEELLGLKNFKFEIRVRYSETDMSGYPHHSKYFVWLEESRLALLRELGISYRVMEEEGIFLPIVEANCRLLSPVKMDDMVGHDANRWAAFQFPRAKILKAEQVRN